MSNVAKPRLDSKARRNDAARIRFAQAYSTTKLYPRLDRGMESERNAVLTKHNRNGIKRTVGSSINATSCVTLRDTHIIS